MENIGCRDESLKNYLKFLWKKVKSVKIFQIQSQDEQVVTIFLPLNFLQVTWIQTWLDLQLSSMQKEFMVCVMTPADCVLQCCFSIWHLIS